MEAVLPSSMVVAQEVAGKLHRKITAKRLIDGESSSSEEEVDIEPEEVLPLKEDNKEIIEKPTSAAALRRKSKDVILQAKETAQLLAKHHKAQLEKQKAEKDKDKKWMKERDIERDKERETEAKAVTFTGIAAKPVHGRKSNASAVRKTLISQSMEGRASFRASIESDYEEKLRIAREEFVDEWLKKEEAGKRKKGQPKFNLIDYHESMMTERAKSPQLEIVTVELPFSSTSPVTTVPLTRLSPQTVFEKPKSPTTMAKDILLQFVAPSSLTDQPQIVLTSDLLVPSPLKAGNVDKEKEALRLQVLSRPDAEENENAYEYASKVDLLKLISGIDNLPQRIKDIKLRKLRFLQKEKEEKLKQKEEEESKKKIQEEEIRLKKQVEERQARLGSPAPSSRASTAAASKRRKAYQEKSMEEVEKLLTTLLNGVDMIQANMHTELSLANTAALPIPSPNKLTKSKIPSVIGSPQKTLTSTIATNESFGGTARSAFSPSRSVQSSPQKNSETHSDLYNQLKAYLDRLKFLKLQRFIKRRRRQETLNKSQLLDLLFYYQSLPESHWKELEKQLSKQDLYEKSDEEIAKEEEEQLLSLYIPTDSTVEESMNTILGDYMNVQEVDELIRRRNEEMKLKEKEREKERTPRKTVIPQESIRRSFIQPGADAASLVQRKNSIMSRGHTSIRMSHLIIDGRILLPDGLNISNSQYEEYRPKTADATIEKKSDNVAVSPTAQMEMTNNLGDEGDDRWEKMTDTLFSVAEPNCMDEIHDLAFNNAISATATEDINNAKFFRQPSISEYDLVNGEEREGEDDVSIKENLLDKENRRLASKVVAEEDIDIINDKEHSYRSLSILYAEDQINFQHDLIAEEEHDHPEAREGDETVFVDEDLLEILQHLIAQLPALTKVMRRMSVTRPPTSFQSSLPPPQTREGREGRAITPAITAEIVSNPLHDNDPLIRNSIRPTTCAAPTPVAPNHPSGTGNFSFHYQNRIDPVLGLHQNVNEDIKKLFLAKPPPINSRMNTPAVFYKNHQRSARPTIRKHRVMESEATKKNLKSGAAVKFGLLGKTMAITPSIHNATARIELKIPQPDLSSLTDDNQDPSSSGKIQSNQFDDSYDDYYNDEFQGNNHHLLLSQLEQNSDYQLYTSSLEGKGEHGLDQVNLRQSLGEYNPTMSTISHELWSEQFKQALIPQSSSPPYLADPTAVTSDGLHYQTIMDYYGNTSSNLLISGKSFTAIEGSASPSSPSRTASPKNEKKKMTEDSFNEIPTVRRSQQNYQHLPMLSPSLSLHSNSPNETPSFAFSSSFHLSNSPNQRNLHGEELNLQSREEDHRRDSIDYTPVNAIVGDSYQEPFYQVNIFRRDEEVSPSSLHGPSVFSLQSAVRVSPLTLKDTNMLQSHHEAGSMLSHKEEKTNHLDTESMNTLLKEIRGKKFVLPSPKRIPPPRSHYSDNTMNSINNMKKMNNTERVHGTSEGVESHDIPGSTRRSNRWNYLLDYLETTFESGKELYNQDSGEHSSTNRELKPAIVSIIVPEVQPVLSSPPPSATKHQTFRPNTASQAIMRQPNSSSSSAAFQSPNRRNRIIKDKKVIESLPTNENQEESNKVLHITGFLSKVGGQEWNKPSSFQ